MTLATVVSELLREIPELKPACDAEFSYYGSDTPSAYLVFSTILRPAAMAAIERGDEAAARRYFDFFERVAASPDEDVNSLSHIELIEYLAGSRERMTSAWPYMGEHTREQARDYARAVKGQFNLDVWLPQ